VVVLVIEEDGLLGIAPGGNVIEGVRKFEAQRSCIPILYIPKCVIARPDPISMLVQKKRNAKTKDLILRFCQSAPPDIPPGHMPPPGKCRIWYPNRPPGQQPPW